MPTAKRFRAGPFTIWPTPAGWRFVPVQIQPRLRAALESGLTAWTYSGFRAEHAEQAFRVHFPPGEQAKKHETALFRWLNWCRWRAARILLAAERAGELVPAACREAAVRLADADAARNTIVATNAGLAHQMVYRTHPREADRADLVQRAAEKIMDAAVQFDCERGIRFSTYACRAIIVELMHLRDRTDRRRAMEVDCLDLKLVGSLVHPFAESERSQDLYAMLPRAGLTTREKRVLMDRYGLDGRAPQRLSELSVVMRVTRQRVQQIEAKALRKLRAVLSDN